MKWLALGLLWAIPVSAQFDAQFEPLPKGGDLHHHFKFSFSMRWYWEGVRDCQLPAYVQAGREQAEGGQAPHLLDTFRKTFRHYFNNALALHGGKTDPLGHDVRETLLLGATRIGHGTNLISDPDTMLLRNGITLIEVSLVSNLLLGYVPNLAEHPFPEYPRTAEYWLAVKHFNLSCAEIRQMGRWSLELSFAEPSVKQALLQRYDRELAAFEAVRPRISGLARRRIFS